MKNTTANGRRAIRMLCIAGAVALVLSACGTRHVSRDISPEGVAGEVVFPDVERIVLKDGTFPNIENLRNIGAGITKDQLYQALGRPHFREALYGVREWDYLFHFRTDEGIVTCQYKVIFDREGRGQSFHWAPASCADRLRTEVVVDDTPTAESRFELSADALFAFAKFGRDDILADGRNELIALAPRLTQGRDISIRVVGHTDRIGSDDANQRLSERRAATVRAFLVEHGVPAASIVAEGRGESMPVTTGCSDDLARQALVDCLKQDRRVELFVTGLQAE